MQPTPDFVGYQIWNNRILLRFFLISSRNLQAAYHATLRNFLGLIPPLSRDNGQAQKSQGMNAREWERQKGATGKGKQGCRKISLQSLSRAVQHALRLGFAHAEICGHFFQGIHIVIPSHESISGFRCQRAEISADGLREQMQIHVLFRGIFAGRQAAEPGGEEKGRKSVEMGCRSGRSSAGGMRADADSRPVPWHLCRKRSLPARTGTGRIPMPANRSVTL